MLQPPPSEELARYRDLAQHVLVRAVEDLRDPRHVLGAASWLLTEAPDSVWADWTGLHARAVRPGVLAAVEKIISGQGFRKRRPSPRTVEALVALVRRHRQQP